MKAASMPSAAPWTRSGPGIPSVPSSMRTTSAASDAIGPLAGWNEALGAPSAPAQPGARARAHGNLRVFLRRLGRVLLPSAPRQNRREGSVHLLSAVFFIPRIEHHLLS